MKHTRLSNESKTTDIGVLADIAHALSFIGDWKMRIRNSLCLVESKLPKSKAVCGIDILGWNFFYCRVAIPDLELEESLLESYQLLTSDIYIEEVTADERPVVGSCITFPIIAAGEIIGVIHVESEIKDAFSVDDISFISVVSTMIGSFAKNVLASDEEAVAKRELEEYAETATRHVYLLQRALLPSKPWIGHGYDLCIYIPSWS